MNVPVVAWFAFSEDASGDTAVVRRNFGKVVAQKPRFDGFCRGEQLFSVVVEPIDDRTGKVEHVGRCIDDDIADFVFRPRTQERAES